MKQSVVVVDHDRETLSTIAQILSPHYDVQLFRDGQKALAHLRSSEPPSLLMSDLRLPGLNGFMVLNEARRICPGLKTMLLSGYLTGSCESELGIVSKFAQAMICKPFCHHELIGKIKKLLGC